MTGPLYMVGCMAAVSSAVLLAVGAFKLRSMTPGEGVSDPSADAARRQFALRLSAGVLSLLLAGIAAMLAG